MNKRKLISIALCAAVCVGSTISLASCNNTANDTSSKTESAAPASSASSEDSSDTESSESKESSTEESKTESKENSKNESSAEESSKEESKTEESSQESKEESSNTSSVTTKVETAVENLEEFEKTVTPSASAAAADFKESRTYKNFFEKLSSGDGHFKLTGTISSGITASMNIEYQKQGDNIYSETSVLGISSTVIQKDGKTYTHSAMFGDSYLVTDASEQNTAASLIESEGLDSDAMKILEAGTIDISGKTYNYEKIGSTDNDDTVLVTYFDGDQLTSIEIFSTNGTSDSSDSKNLKKAGTLSGEFDLAIDEKLFELNPDYQVLTEDEFYSQASGMFGDITTSIDRDDSSEVNPDA